jgi:hypothetical protein
MIKKWVKSWVKEWVLNRQHMVIGWLVRPIIHSLQKSGINFYQINKWLRHIGHAPVRGYMVLPNKEKLVFFKDVPDQERRKHLGGEYRVVEVKNDTL